MTTILFDVLVFLGAYTYSSFPEWAVHKYWMHRVFTIFGWRFEYPFRAHALIHHTVFRADHTYDLGDHPPETQGEHKDTITMAWWNGPVLVLIASLPFIIVGYFLHSWKHVGIVALAIFAYYCTYEYLHLCMHHSKGRWFESTRLFQRMNEHHRLHHAQKNKNFNVVLRLADFCLGTLVRK